MQALQRSCANAAEADEAPLSEESQVERIQTMIAARLRPVRPLAPARFFLGTCAIIFLSVVAIGITPSGMEGWAALNGMQRIAVFATMATGAVLLAVSMIGQMAPGNKYALASALLPIGVLTVLIMILAVTFRPREELAFVQSGLACVGRGLTYSIPAAFLFWLVARRYPFSEANRGSRRRTGQPNGLHCAGAQLPGRECVSYRGVALGRGSDRYGFLRAHRHSR
jgi:hypothetical protein